MAQKTPELGRAIAKILEKHGSDSSPMSFQSAATRTRVENADGTVSQLAHETIRGWVNGQRPKVEYLRQFADGFKEPRVPLLRLGFHVVTEMDLEWDRVHYGVLPSSHVHVTDDFSGDLRERGQVVRPRISTEGDSHLRCSPPEYNPDDPDVIDVSDKISGLVVRGNSMLPYYYQGDLVFLRPIEDRIQVGETYVIRIDGDRTCKILEAIEHADGEDFLVFAAANSVYPRIRVASSRVIFQGMPITKIPKELL